MQKSRRSFLKKSAAATAAISTVPYIWTSAASAASAAIDHMHDWELDTPACDWVSMAIPSDGSYDVPEGIISSFPVTCSGGEISIVQGLDIDDFSRGRIDASAAELVGERDTVSGLGLI